MIIRSSVAAETPQQISRLLLDRVDRLENKAATSAA
jgi:hypothetical protein